MFALVHSPLTGPGVWAPAAAALRARGANAYVASLSIADVGAAPFAQALAAQIAPPDTREDLALVLHSGAGALAWLAAAHLGERVKRIIFVDALLPRPGRSWFDDAPPDLRARITDASHDGFAPPWWAWLAPGALERLLPDPAVRAAFVAQTPSAPLRYFREPAPLTPTAPQASASCAYLRLSPAYAAEHAVAEENAWRTRTREWTHLAMVTSPEAVAEDLIALAAP